MAAHDREVAGVRCSEVLAQLSDYVDGVLPHAAVARVEAHLKGCDWCERFGGQFGAAVAGLRAALAEADPVPDAVKARLRDRLRVERAPG